jgi:two-component sensor histidine kinase
VPTAPLSFWQGQGLAAICLISAFLLRVALNPVLGVRGVFFTFFPAVLIASVGGGPWSGVTMLLAGAALGDYFWLRPQESLRAEQFGNQFLAAFLLYGALMVVAGVLLQRLITAHRAAEEEAQLLAREMRHRLRNVLGLVAAISQQTARRSKTFQDYQEHFQSRLDALGAALAVDLEDEKAIAPTDLDKLLTRVLHPFGHERCNLAGPPVSVGQVAATPLALTIHELATNAVKYGALSVPDGRVEITWRREDHRVMVEWREIGGPPVQPPANPGFGTRLIRSIFSPAVGKTEVIYAEAGVICRICF